MAIIAVLRQRITNMIKRFKFGELESSIMPIFPEISWDNVKSKLVEHHNPLTSTNVAPFIKLAIAEKQLEMSDLKDRLSTLQLIDISWHSKRKLWYGYALTDSNKSTIYFINRQIQNDMQNRFHNLNIKINIKVNTHNGITYVSLIKNKRTMGRKGPILFTTTFLALFPGQTYFFCNKKFVPPKILYIIASSLGYNKFKRLKLKGRDLKSLSNLRWMKKEGALNSDNISKTLIYEDAAPDIKNTVVVFTQQEQRKKYSKMSFGNDSTTLDTLHISVPSTPLKAKDISMKLPNENMRVSWEFGSQNVPKFLERLIERGILTTPMPNYISNVLSSEKNESNTE